MTQTLKRRIGLGLMVGYGVGVMVGAGIYVLVGAIAADAGIWAPLSLVVAGLIAAPTALSYAEFSSRLPEAAGEAAYVRAGLNNQALALLAGLAIVASGIVSGGAVLRGGVGYLTAATDIPTIVAILALGVTLTIVAVAGVLESLALVAVFTVIELAGLALVVWAGMGAEPSTDWVAAAPPVWAGIGLGGVLAFFAFIGFEDMVNMAEEVERPERNMPYAIVISLAVTSAIYALVCWGSGAHRAADGARGLRKPAGAGVANGARRIRRFPLGHRGLCRLERCSGADRHGQSHPLWPGQTHPGAGHLPSSTSAPGDTGAGNRPDRCRCDQPGSSGIGRHPGRDHLRNPAGRLRTGQPGPDRSEAPRTFRPIPGPNGRTGSGPGAVAGCAVRGDSGAVVSLAAGLVKRLVGDGVGPGCIAWVD